MSADVLGHDPLGKKHTPRRIKDEGSRPHLAAVHPLEPGGSRRAAQPEAEDRARGELEALLREAIDKLGEERRGGLSESEIKDLLRNALSEATGELPRGRSSFDLLGELAGHLTRTLPVGQVLEALQNLEPERVTNAMRIGLSVARGLLRNLHPRHLASVDEFGFDQELTKDLVPFFDFMFSTYWRCDFYGAENVPETGRGLIVANHSGVVPWDATMLVTGLRKHHPTGRHLRCLMLDLFATMPFLGMLCTRLGQIRACPENGLQLLDRDHLVGVFPEGLKGIGKLYSQRYQLQRFGRGGYVRLAMRAGAPIFPAAVVGGEEIYPLFYRADWLARLFSFPYFPITLTFPWLGLAGVLPLPSKWVIQIGEAIDLSEYNDAAIEDDLLVSDLSDQIKTKIQSMLHAGLRHRRRVFLG